MLGVGGSGTGSDLHLDPQEGRLGCWGWLLPTSKAPPAYEFDGLELVGSGRRFDSVIARGLQACALERGTGDLWCLGLLGRARSVSDDVRCPSEFPECARRAVRVETPAPFVEVAIATVCGRTADGPQVCGQAACGRTADGRLFCPEGPTVPTFTEVPVDARLTRLTYGNRTVCGLDAAGGVHCGPHQAT